MWGQDVYFGIADVNFNNVYEFTLNEILNDATFDGKFMVDSMFWLPDGQGILLFINSCNPTCSLTKLIILAKNGEVQVDYDVDTLNNIMDVLWSSDGKMMIVSSYSRSDEGVLMKRYYEFNFLSGFEEFLGPELVDSELLTNLHWVP